MAKEASSDLWFVTSEPQSHYLQGTADLVKHNFSTHRNPLALGCQLVSQFSFRELMGIPRGWRQRIFKHSVLTQMINGPIGISQFVPHWVRGAIVINLCRQVLPSRQMLESKQWVPMPSSTPARIMLHHLKSKQIDAIIFKAIDANFGVNFYCSPSSWTPWNLHSTHVLAFCQQWRGYHH